MESQSHPEMSLTVQSGLLSLGPQRISFLKSCLKNKCRKQGKWPAALRLPGAPGSSSAGLSASLVPPLQRPLPHGCRTCPSAGRICPTVALIAPSAPDLGSAEGGSFTQTDAEVAPRSHQGASRHTWRPGRPPKAGWLGTGRGETAGSPSLSPTNRQVGLRRVP